MAEDETDSPRDTGSLRPMPAGRLEVGMYAELGGRLCKITELVVSKPGKHVINAHIGGVVVQSGQHVSEVVRAADLVPATRAPQREYTLLDIDGSDGFVTLLSEKNEEKGDVRLPGGTLGKAIKTRFEAGREVIVTVLELLGEQKIVAYR